MTTMTTENEVTAGQRRRAPLSLVTVIGWSEHTSSWVVEGDYDEDGVTTWYVQPEHLASWPVVTPLPPVPEPTYSLVCPDGTPSSYRYTTNESAFRELENWPRVDYLPGIVAKHTVTFVDEAGMPVEGIAATGRDAKASLPADGREVHGEPTKPKGHACTSCKTTVADCDETIKRRGIGCCTRCTTTDTHGLTSEDSRG